MEPCLSPHDLHFRNSDQTWANHTQCHVGGRETSPRWTDFAFSNKRKLEYDLHYIDPRDGYETILMKFCRTKDWKSVMERCKSHPEEATPTLFSNDKTRFCRQGSKRVAVDPMVQKEQELTKRIFHETPLGVACASTCIDAVEMYKVVVALIKACPFQVRVSQLEMGNTPLRDAVLNLHCTRHVLRLLLDADTMCSNDCHCEEESALLKKDQNGLLPSDHILMGLQLGTSSKSMDLFKEFFDQLSGQSIYQRTGKSPLIQLLSMGSSSTPTSHNSHREWLRPSRNSRILEATKYLLSKDPSLLKHCFQLTGCSPLHVALRHYGDFLPLIQALCSVEFSDEMLRSRNRNGDYPLHVACAVGVPFEVLKFIVQCSIAAHSSQSHPDSNDPLPCPLIWSANSAGYTPIDLEWIQHTEGGKGFASTKAFYPIESGGVRRNRFKPDTYYQDLLREAVDYTILRPNNLSTAHERKTSSSATFGDYLERVSVLISGAASSYPLQFSPTLLHDVCKLSTLSGPCLPLALCSLFLWMYQDQLLVPDQFGLLPLHYALRQVNHEPCHKPNEWKKFVLELLKGEPKSSTVKTTSGRLPLHILLDDATMHKAQPRNHSDDRNQAQDIARESILQELVRLHPTVVELDDPQTGLLPFQLAATNATIQLDTLYFLLRHSPSSCHVQTS